MKLEECKGNSGRHLLLNKQRETWTARLMNMTEKRRDVNYVTFLN